MKNRGAAVSKVSMLEASKLFQVSRPTLLKHLQQGKISGERVTVDKNTFWKLDVSELARVYDRRGEVVTPAPVATPDLPVQHTNHGTDPTPGLQAEIKLLQAKLDAAERLLEERQKHLDDLRLLLERPVERAQEPAPRRRWWPW